MATTVIDVLRRFLPSFQASAPPLCPAQWRAIWAITHCRTPAMGGRFYGCDKCGTREFAQWANENTPGRSRFLTMGPSLGNILRFYGYRDSVALSVSQDPARRNPAYVPVPNPDLAIRQMAVQYLVWDAYTADR